jgi:hypothetical protein
MKPVYLASIRRTPPHSFIGLCDPAESPSRLGELLADCARRSDVSTLHALLLSEIVLTADECLTIRQIIDHQMKPLERAFSDIDLALALKWPLPESSPSPEFNNHLYSQKKTFWSSDPPRRADGVWRKLHYGPLTLAEKLVSKPVKLSDPIAVSPLAQVFVAHADDVQDGRLYHEAAHSRFITTIRENVSGIRPAPCLPELDKIVQTATVSRCVHGVMSCGTMFEFNGDGSLLELPRNRTVKRKVEPNDGLVRDGVTGEVITRSVGKHGATHSSICQACRLGIGAWRETRTIFANFATVNAIAAQVKVSKEPDRVRDSHWSSYLISWVPSGIGCFPDHGGTGLSILYMAMRSRIEHRIFLQPDLHIFKNARRSLAVSALEPLRASDLVVFFPQPLDLNSPFQQRITHLKQLEEKYFSQPITIYGPLDEEEAAKPLITKEEYLELFQPPRGGISFVSEAARRYRMHGPIARARCETSPSTPMWLKALRADKVWLKTASLNFGTQVCGDYGNVTKAPRVDVLDEPITLVQEIEWTKWQEARFRAPRQREMERFWRVADFKRGLREGGIAFLMQHKIDFCRSFRDFALELVGHENHATRALRKVFRVTFGIAEHSELETFIRMGLAFEWQAVNGGQRVNKASKSTLLNLDHDYSNHEGDTFEESSDSNSQDRRADGAFYDSKPWEREAVTLGRLCPECGAEIRKRKGTKFCSDVCQEKNWKRAHKENIC